MAATDHQRIIIKVGSALLVDPDGAVRRAWLKTLVADIADRHRAGHRIVIVSSGAIALGARRLHLTKGGRASLDDAQAAAAVGQIALAGVWTDLLAAQGLTAAQILVTLDDLEDRRRFLNASATVNRLLNLGCVPIVNENDSVATQEIRFGDNDRLAARVAQAAGAKAVILLSDVDGLYSANPKTNPGATRLDTVPAITPAILALASADSTSGMGSGGMVSKLQAARIATKAGADLIIISGQHRHPLSRMARGDGGTRFVAAPAERARKGWLAGRLTAKGRIGIDSGAAKALLAGKSLLAAGITMIDGKFDRGDVIDIIDPDGATIARGLAAYDAADCQAIAGQSTAAQASILGYAPRSAVVHRDHMVLL